jgi:hypothetical protein
MNFLEVTLDKKGGSMKYLDVKNINCRYPKNKYVFSINKTYIQKEKMENYTDEENFILFSGEGKRVEDIITEFENEFNTNSYFSMEIIWDTIHLFYCRGIIEWKGDNPFKDFYEYESKDTKINIIFPWQVDKYRGEEEAEALYNIKGKGIDNYTDWTVKNSSEFSDKNLFIKVSKGEETLIRLTFLPYEKEYSFIIGMIGIYGEEVTPKLLENTFIWASSKLSLIFNNFCRTFELRIKQESLDSLEVTRLEEIGFNIESFFEDGETKYILSKTV